ncbi:MAG: GNAT family N-acetyltransferase, partial [Clostridium sp.]
MRRVEIRKAKIEDAENYLNMLINLDRETKFMMFEEGERTISVKEIEGIIEKSVIDENLLLVATFEEEIVGFLLGSRGTLNRIKHSLYVAVGIRENFRGQKIGMRFFLELHKWCEEKEIKRAELTVMCHNEKAKKLYEKNGF